MIDKKAKLYDKAPKLVNREYTVWLMTVGSDLAPQPRPVWFIRDKGSFLIFSQARADKLKHIQNHPKVSLHFNTDETSNRIQ